MVIGIRIYGKRLASDYNPPGKTSPPRQAFSEYIILVPRCVVQSKLVVLFKPSHELLSPYNNTIDENVQRMNTNS